jgi:NAD-dependent dihydropyrimidine dehydrogenase PreA subunit
MGRMIYLKDVVTLGMEPDKCVGCKMCLLVCPHAVFALNNGTAVIKDRDACIECGACSKNCPADAITVRPGVGCAAAVINTALGRKGDACCCIIESPKNSGEILPGSPGAGANKASCC